MVSGVGGGAVRIFIVCSVSNALNINTQLYAPLQGVLSDSKTVQIGYWVAFAGYVNALAYGVGMCIDKERRKRIDSKTGKPIDATPPTYVEDASEKSGTEKSAVLEAI